MDATRTGLREQSTEELLRALPLDHPAVRERLRLLRGLAVAGETSRSVAREPADSASSARNAIVPSAPTADRASGVYARSERKGDGEGEQGGAGDDGCVHAPSVRSRCAGRQSP